MTGKTLSETQEEIIDQIQMLAEDGDTPTITSYNDHPDTFAQNTVYEHFDSWNDALDHAGYSPNIKPPSRFTDEELVEGIRMLAEDGNPPSSTEYNDHPETASRTIVIRRFGTWDDALVAAGFEPSDWGKSEDVDHEEVVEERKEKMREKIINSIQRLSDGDSPPTRDEFDADEESPAATTTTVYFDSWNDAVREAGFDPNPPGRKQVYTDEEMLDHIRRLAEDGIAPSHSTVHEDGESPTVLSIANRFGSWEEAVTKAGLEKAN